MGAIFPFYFIIFAFPLSQILKGRRGEHREGRSLKQRFYTGYYQIIIAMEAPKKQGTDEPKMAILDVNRYEVEENAVFTDYTKEALLNSIQHFKSLSVHQRSALAKNIDSVRQILGRCSSQYQHFLKLLASDCEANQSELITFLRSEHENFKHDEVYCSHMIDPLKSLINRAHLDIKEQSCKLLIQILHYLKIEEREGIIHFAKHLLIQEDDDTKIVGLQLMCRLSKYMHQVEAQKFFKTECINLYENGTLRIKKEVVYNCVSLGKYVTEHFFDHEILELFFAEKCKETIIGVRKTCAQIFPQLICYTQNHKVFLANLLLHLIKDHHKIIRLTACKVVPQFIAKYHSANVPDQLFQFYLGLAEHEVNKIVNRENEVLYPVAYYFSAILKLMGAGSWKKMIRLFNKLLFFKSQEVNLPIASSLHQIAQIIGPEDSREYIFPAFNNIFKSNSDQLQIAAMTHFSDFVSIFQAPMRENLIDVFMVLQRNPKKWRMRLEIAKQLGSIAHVYQPEILFRYIFPISLKLCNDTISCVREEASLNMWKVIHGMSKDPTYENIAEQSLKGFGLSKQYIQRETFARMAETLYQLPDFNTKYLDILYLLASDSVVNVKCALMISITRILKEDPDKTETFQPILEILKVDEEIKQSFD